MRLIDRLFVGCSLAALAGLAIYSYSSDGKATKVAPSSAHSAQTQTSASEKLVTATITKAQTATTARTPARAQLADQQQLTAAFQDAHECHSAASIAKDLQNQIDSCNAAPDDACKKNTAGLDEQVRQANARLAVCDAIPVRREEAYFETTARAARVGDLDAQVCYVKSYFDLGRSYTDVEIDQYKLDAGRFVDQGLERGDWRMVEIMMTPSSSMAHVNTMLSWISDGSPLTIYRMNRFLRLGAVGGYAQSLDILGHTEVLTAEQVATANEWVLSEFKLHFANAPKLTERPEPCED